MEKKNKEIQNLKKALAELIMKNNLKKDVYEGLSKETAEVMKNVSKENGGKIDLNDEQTEYAFKKTKNMFEGIVQSKPEANKTEEKKDSEKVEPLQTLENKIVQKDQNETSESNEVNEANESNETNEENKTNDNN